MKRTAIIVLPLLTGAVVIDRRPMTATLQPRQTSMPGMFGGAAQAPVSVKKLAPQYNPNAIHEKVLWGPFKLSPKSAKHRGIFDAAADTFGASLTGICGDCVVLRAVADPVFANGSLADIKGGVYNHHLGIGITGKSQTPPPINIMCNGINTVGFGIPAAIYSSSKTWDDFIKWIGLEQTWEDMQSAPFVTNGGESADIVFMAKDSGVKSGYFLKKKYKYQASLELINYDDFEKDIYLALDYEYIPNTPSDYLSVSMAAMNTDTCYTIAFSPPKDKPYHIQSPEYTVIDDGYLLNIIPHLHDGGINVKVFNNGNLICDSDAKYGRDGKSSLTVNGERWETITGYKECNDAYPIKKGDKLSMTALYDLTKYKIRPKSVDHQSHTAIEKADSMAFIFFQFAKGNSSK